QPRGAAGGRGAQPRADAARHTHHRRVHRAAAQRDEKEFLTPAHGYTAMAATAMAATNDAQVVLLTGLSGSGKSVALNVLEDSGYYCIDNLPIAMLAGTVHHLLTAEAQRRIAVSIDARGVGSVHEIPGYLGSLRARDIDVRLIFLDAKDDTLLRRFAET